MSSNIQKTNKQTNDNNNNKNKFSFFLAPEGNIVTISCQVQNCVFDAGQVWIFRGFAAASCCFTAAAENNDKTAERKTN